MQLFQADAFTTIPFKGNPAAVCILNEPKGEEWMRDMAAEMNLSETAFLVEQPQRDDLSTSHWNLRWFTPTVEIALCGHATLASAHILWEQNIVSREKKLIFHTVKSGELYVKQENDWIVMDFPSLPPKDLNQLETGLLNSLGLNETSIIYKGRNQYDLLLVVDREDVVHSLKPDFVMLKNFPYRCVVISSKGSKQYDFITRVFAPSAGINEDPVTGSAHCMLAPYWNEILKKKELLAYQASARGGELKLRLHDDRTLLIGQSVTIFKAVMMI